MKAITLTQPWATLVAIGAKRIETRGEAWAYGHRGEIAIHASKAFPRDDQALCYQQPFARALGAAGYNAPAELPVGAILALDDLREVLVIRDARNGASILGATNSSFFGRDTDEYAFGNFSSGRKALVLGCARRLAEPVRCRGMLGVWLVPPGIQKLVREALAE